jgi:prepilin-type N-terminal cleavage/methylation domain-containing protein
MIQNIKFQISNRQGRTIRGFTLVEVLVVIAIIGILVGLLVPAIMAAQVRARQTVVKTEMQQIAMAIENLKSSVGQYPPDGTSTTDMQQYCKARWGRVYWAATANYGATPPQVPFPTITPDTALCFWLGGAQDSDNVAGAAPNFIGFSANPQNPFDGSASRVAATYDFPRDTAPLRVVWPGATSGLPAITTTTPPVYWNLYQCFPPNRKDPSSGTYAPYLYLKAVAGSYNGDIQAGTNKTSPYKDASGAFINPQSFQLLCPGLDGQYGSYTGGKFPSYPGGTNYDQTNGLDDMTNFTNGSIVGDDVK